jgi:hypothetical protein
MGLKIHPARRRIFIVVLLIISISNYYMISKAGNVRAVEFLSIFAIGMLSGLLIREFFEMIKNKYPL